MSLPLDTLSLGDFTDGYSFREIPAEDFAGVRRAVHVAHGRCLSVVVQVIDEFDIVLDESEDNWPDFKPGGRARSATVAIRKADVGVIGA